MEDKISRLMSGAVAIFIIQAGLGPRLLFGAPFGGIALNVYVAAGLGTLFFVAVRDQLQTNTRRQIFEQFVEEVVKNNTPQWWRNRIHQWLFYMIRITCWPALEAYNLRLRALSARLRTRFAKNTAVSLYPPDTNLSVFLLILPALVTGCVAVSAPPFTFSIYFLWLLVFTLFLKHISYVIGIQTVQERLRCGQDSPLVSYGLITVCDFLGLVLCYNGIANWSAGDIFQFQAVTSVMTRLLALKDLIGAFEHPPQRLIDYWIGISGLLWYATLATSLLQFLWKTYRRTASDYLRQAASYTMLGVDDRARTALDAAEVTGKLPSALKADLYAALGDFDKATIYARRFLVQAEGMPPPSKDLSYIFQELYAGITTFRNTSELVCRYVEYGGSHGLSDVLLAHFALLTGDVDIDPGPVARFVKEGGLID